MAAGSIDLAWSNLALQWVNALPQAFAEMRRVLAPGGLFMFTTFGPDTLKELRAAQAGIDGHTHVSRFIDMHDIGDMLVQAGFADPVIDMETFTLTYDGCACADARSEGDRRAQRGRDRPPALSGKSWLAAVERNYERLRRDGKLPATFEVIYGHAWRPVPRARTRRPPGDRHQTGRRRLKVHADAAYLLPAPTPASAKRWWPVRCCAGWPRGACGLSGMKPVAAGAAPPPRGLVPR